MWYGASLLLRGRSPSVSESDERWEESIVLIDAVDDDDAIQQADEIGRSAERETVSPTGETIHWTFEAIERVYEIGETLISGSEVFCRFVTPDEVERLMNEGDNLHS